MNHEKMDFKTLGEKKKKKTRHEKVCTVFDSVIFFYSGCTKQS